MLGNQDKGSMSQLGRSIFFIAVADGLGPGSSNGAINN
jgi:hypothetical protein